MPQSAHLDQLRATLAGIEPARFHRRPAMPFGVPDVDAGLVDGGLRLDALHEVAGHTPALADERAATLFVAGIAARTWGPILWVVRRRDLFAPRLERVGLTTDRLLLVEAADDAELLALMEEGLRHRALGAVVGQPRHAGLAATRRLQLAASGGRTIAMLLRRAPQTTVDPFKAASAAATRWRVGYAPPIAMTRGRRRAIWMLTVAQQEGDAVEAQVTACDRTGRCAPAEDSGQRQTLIASAAA